MVGLVHNILNTVKKPQNSLDLIHKILLEITFIISVYCQKNYIVENYMLPKNLDGQT